MTKHNFEAQTGKILELLTHSIYSNKEIFLRELISNASDAIDKARLKSLTDTTFLGDDSKFEIQVTLDEEKNIIEICDNGIGMTLDELHSCIGTIAKSGTQEFMEKLAKAKEQSQHNLIGQFGVGFYSAFMVADKVEVETKSPLDSKAYKWVSDGKSEYEVLDSDKTTRGTVIRLFVDEANKELVTDWKIRELIKKYSNYVGVPIMMLEPKNDENKEKQRSFQQVNETKSIWTKSKSEVKDEEYKEFYKTVSMDFNEPLAHIHTAVEGSVSYKSLLYIPKQKNMFANMSDPNMEYGPKLYVQNVLILENSKELLPVWLRFVSGVVETSDIPLNISREMLQSNDVLTKIQKALTKKVVGELKKVMKKDPDGYNEFLENYGSMLKEGIYYDSENKQDIAATVKFETLLSDQKISLDEYIEKLESTGKKEIYYITGKSKAEVLASPYLAQFQDAKVDVLLLTDHVDGFMMQTFHEYKEYTFKSVSDGDIQLKEESEEEKKQAEEKKKEFKDLLELTKNTIGADKIEKVELNDKLLDALGALKTPSGGLTPQMEEMYRAMGQPVPPQKRILELNPNHKLVEAMKKEFQADVKSQKLSDLISYAYEQAILLEGGKLDDMAGFITKVNKFAAQYLK